MKVLEDHTNNGKKHEDVNRNNLVAQSDLQKALDALGEHFENQQTPCTMEIDGKINNANNFHLTTAGNHVLRACSSSLQENLIRMVQAVPDDDFQNALDKHHPPEDLVKKRDQFIPENKDDEKYEVLDQDEFQFEEEDLLDPKAIQQAKELRTKVRFLSESVQKLRRSVIQRASDESVVVENSVVNRKLLNSDDRPGLSLSKKLSDQSRQRLGTSLGVDACLVNLCKLLSHPNLAEMPNRTNALQETMDIIEKDTSSTRTLSQTESAIVSRTNGQEDETDAHQRDLLSSSSPDDNKSPEDRLADFLAKVAI